jgi:predicted dehydrogenase
VRSVRVVRACDRGLERSSLMVFEYEGGAVGTLTHSWETPSRLRGLHLSRISGTHGSIVFESNGLFVLTPSRLILPGLADLAGYGAMLRDFIEALESGREPLMTLDRAQRDQEMIENAYWEPSLVTPAPAARSSSGAYR